MFSKQTMCRPFTLMKYSPIFVNSNKQEHAVESLRGCSSNRERHGESCHCHYLLLHWRKCWREVVVWELPLLLLPAGSRGNFSVLPLPLPPVMCGISLGTENEMLWWVSMHNILCATDVEWENVLRPKESVKGKSSVRGKKHLMENTVVMYQLRATVCFFWAKNTQDAVLLSDVCGCLTKRAWLVLSSCVSLPFHGNNLACVLYILTVIFFVRVGKECMRSDVSLTFSFLWPC